MTSYVSKVELLTVYVILMRLHLHQISVTSSYLILSTQKVISKQVKVYLCGTFHRLGSHKVKNIDCSKLSQYIYIYIYIIDCFIEKYSIWELLHNEFWHYRCSGHQLHDLSEELSLSFSVSISFHRSILSQPSCLPGPSEVSVVALTRLLM